MSVNGGMPMQVGLDQVLSMLMTGIDRSNMEIQNLSSRFNIMFRILFKKGLFTEDDVRESVKDEHSYLKEIGLIDNMPSDDDINKITDDILVWIKGDVETLKKGFEEQKAKIDEIKKKQQSRIEVAPSDVLSQLNQASKQAGKIII